MPAFKSLALAPVMAMAMVTGFAADKDALVGSWRLVSFEREYQSTGEREYPMGKAPTGYILFPSAGPMAVVITGEGRKAATTDQDRAGLLNSVVAYTGPYRVDGDKWITTVDVSANRPGSAQNKPDPSESPATGFKRSRLGRLAPTTGLLGPS